MSKQFANRLLTLPLKLTNGNFPNSFFAGKGSIFTLHSVVREKNGLDQYNHFIEITKDHLEQTIIYLQRKKYYFVSLNELKYFIENDAFPKQKVVHFSFDDGYLDNLTVASPIFEKHKVPFSIFITTGFPEGDILVWWYLLSELLTNCNKLSLPEFKINLSLSSYSEKDKLDLFNRLAHIIKFNIFKDPHYFDSFFKNHGIEPLQYLEKNALSWNNIQQLHRANLSEIGVHSHFHFPLKSLDEKDMRHEILSSKHLLEKKLGSEMQFYSYPFGSPAEVSKREVNFVEATGFSFALGTQTGNLFSKELNNLFYLPRIFLNDQVNKYAVNMRLNGLYPFLSNNYSRFQQPL